MRIQDHTTLHSFSILTILTVIEKILAFLFQAMIAAKLGAGYITDSYFASAEIFTLIDASLLGALTVAVLKYYTKKVNDENETSAFAMLSDVQSVTLPVMVTISILMNFLSKPLSYLVAPGFPNDTRAVLIRCIRIMSPAPAILCISSIRVAVLRQKKRYEITCLRSLFVSITGTVSLLLFSRWNTQNADTLSIAFLGSSVLFCILTIIISKQYGAIRLYRPKITEDISNIIHMMLPLVISYGITRLSLLIDRIMASMLGEGAVSSLSYSHTLHNFVTAFFITNFSVILLTDFNNLYARKEYESINTKIRLSVSTMLLVLLPISIVTMVFSRQIVSIVFERGSFDSTNTATVAGLLFFYALNFIPAMINTVYNQVLYAFGDTKVTMKNGFISIGFNIVLNVGLTALIGINGIAIGTAISHIIGSALAFRSIRKRLDRFRGVIRVGFVARCALASALSACVGLLLRSNLHIHKILQFGISTVVCFIVFFAVHLITHEQTTCTYFKEIISNIKKNLSRIK